jgi:hypothetical protein
MKRRMNNDAYRKLGITAVKRINNWEILLNGHQIMVGLSEKDFELFREKTEAEVLTILSQI